MAKAIVVGSGAGGCMAAKELAACGLDVTVLEAGRAFRPFTWSMDKLEPARRAGLFFDERMISLLFPEMRIDKAQELVHVVGRAVGGTTTLATGNALRYDRYLAELGIDLDDEFSELEREVPQAAWAPPSYLRHRAFPPTPRCSSTRCSASRRNGRAPALNASCPCRSYPNSPTTSSRPISTG